MGKNKILWILGLASFMLLLSFLSVSASGSDSTMKMDSPDANEVITAENYTICVNVTAHSALYAANNLTNMSFYIDNAVIGQNITTVNASLDTAYCVMYTSSMGLGDITKHTAFARGWNDTSLEILGSAPNVTFYVDNTLPVLGTLTPATDAIIAPGSTFSLSCANTTRAVLYVGSNTYDMTVSNTTCSWSLTDEPPEGFYDVKVIADDWVTGISSTHINQTTSSTSENVEVDEEGTLLGVSLLAQQEAEAAAAAPGKANWGLIVILVIGGYFAYQAFSKKKK